MKLSEAEDYIKHYGKRGMKWGVRSSKPAQGGDKNKSIKVSSQQRKVRKRDILSEVIDTALTVAVFAIPGSTFTAGGHAVGDVLANHGSEKLTA